MKLSVMLYGMLKKKLPRGHIFRGKYRIVKEVTPLAAANLRNDYEREEENMLYLQNPYLTCEQSHGHMKEDRTREEHFQELMKSTHGWKRKNVTIEERLRHLRVTDSWE